MTREEAYDAIAQAPALIASLEKILKKAAEVLEIDLEPPKLKVELPVFTVIKPDLKVVPITDAKQGDPADWSWNITPKWDGKIYGDD